MPLKADTRAKRLNDMHELARRRGGKCLSTEYQASDKHLVWKCGVESHPAWKSTPENTVQGKWCPRCGIEKRSRGKMLTIEEMHSIAAAGGGRFLSSAYSGAAVRHEWKCHVENHPPWLATPNSIKNGSWCPTCGGSKLGTLLEMQMIAESRGGRCLSEKYINAKTPLLWKCQYEGHPPWHAVPFNIKQGSWCPACSQSYGERLLRVHVQHIFGIPFPATRPEWLIGSKGRLLELDCYNEQLALAFEHQGKHHEEPEVKARDLVKQKLCQQRGVTLIEVPEIGPKLRPSGLMDFLLDRIPSELRSSIVNFDAPNLEAHLAEIYSSDQTREFRELQSIAMLRGGKLISTVYLNSSEKLSWQCSNESHPPFEASANSVKSNHWCPRCAGRKAITEEERQKCLEELREIAFEKEGQCLSATFLGGDVKHLWKCANPAHEPWEATPYNVKQGQWCRRCANEASRIRQIKELGYSIEEMRDLALRKGGRCLSTEYGGAKTRLEWKCADPNHPSWFTVPSVILRGGWCKLCSVRDAAKAQRLGIEAMREIAKSRGGQCLSTEYRSINSPLIWKCAVPEHATWSATPGTIKKSWCPQCGRKTAGLKRRLSIAEMHKIAESRGGKCLSTEYVNTGSKLTWKCHVRSHPPWRATPMKIKVGQWCPTCAGKKPKT